MHRSIPECTIVDAVMRPSHSSLLDAAIHNINIPIPLCVWVFPAT